MLPYLELLHFFSFLSQKPLCVGDINDRATQSFTNVQREKSENCYALLMTLWNGLWNCSCNCFELCLYHNFTSPLQNNLSSVRLDGEHRFRWILVWIFIQHFITIPYVNMFCCSSGCVLKVIALLEQPLTGFLPGVPYIYLHLSSYFLWPASLPLLKKSILTTWCCHHHIPP